MNKFNNQYDLIFHLHNEVLNYVYGQKKLEKDIKDKDDLIKRLQQDNYKLCDKIDELENKEAMRNEINKNYNNI